MEKTDESNTVLRNDRKLFIQNYFLDSFEDEPSDFLWNYRDPAEVLEIIEKVPLRPETLNNALDKGRIEKSLVHKRDKLNVLISEAVQQGLTWCFKGFQDIKELNSDHISDHIDGIKLFEAVSQATLASFHLAGLNYNGVVALTSSKIDYLKYVEKDIPYFIQSFPVCREDGGAMNCSFKIIQSNEIMAKGYFIAYTYRSKEIFEQKRKKK